MGPRSKVKKVCGRSLHSSRLLAATIHRSSTNYKVQTQFGTCYFHQAQSC
uniref:Uncharacterized protein n=1 Tax=Arundo donax TaxID=35708 RepID=A0A0A9EQM3_ARUDO